MLRHPSRPTRRAPAPVVAGLAALLALLLAPAAAGQAAGESELRWDVPAEAAAQGTVAVVPVEVTLVVQGVVCAVPGDVTLDVLLDATVEAATGGAANGTDDADVGAAGPQATWHPASLRFQVPAQSLAGAVSQTLPATLTVTSDVPVTVQVAARFEGAAAQCLVPPPAADLQSVVRVDVAAQDDDEPAPAVPGPGVGLVALVLVLMAAVGRRPRGL